MTSGLLKWNEIGVYAIFPVILSECWGGSEAETWGASNDWILAALRVSHIARYASSLRLATIQSFDVILTI